MKKEIQNNFSNYTLYEIVPMRAISSKSGTTLFLKTESAKRKIGNSPNFFV